MPELPEVEYTARQFRAHVVGAGIREAMVFCEQTIGHPALPDFLLEIAGRQITGVRRRGKFLLLDLSGGLLLSVHRRMTGNFLLLPPGWDIDTHLREEDPIQWRVKGPSFVPPEGTPGEQEGRVQVMDRLAAATETAYCRVCFNLTDGRRLLFTDLRKFGRVELWPREQEAEAFRGLGPEPLGADFTVEQFAASLRGRKTGIKQALLMQHVVAGIGNIYADEALFYAAIHPLRPANSLSAAELARLHEGIVAALTQGIEHGGTSFNDYRDLWGEAGENYDHVRVYQREGQPCERCGTPIERVVIAQRSAHYCPNCQRLTAE